MTSFTNKNVLNLLRNLPRLTISNLRNNDGAVKKVKTIFNISVVIKVLNKKKYILKEYTLMVLSNLWYILWIYDVNLYIFLNHKYNEINTSCSY